MLCHDGPRFHGNLFNFRWLEAVLQESLPPVTELEGALQNGVVLCRLGMRLLPDDPMWAKVYDLDQSKFKVNGVVVLRVDFQFQL